MQVRMSQFTMFLAIAALGACSSGPEIRANTDPSANLRSYKTFGFMQPLGTDKAGYSSLVSQQLKTSAKREMERLGYTYAENNPDLLVNFNAKLADKLRVDTVPTSGVGYGYYGYRAGFYGAWPAYTTDVDQYVEGTLNIDVVDVKRQQMVWEGVAVGRITQKAQQEAATRIDAVVTQVFAKYPGATSPADTKVADDK
jgi:Domain of unknown function (DUF4136)